MATKTVNDDWDAPKPTPKVKEEACREISIRIRCRKAFQNEDGTFTITIPGQQLSTMDHERLIALFPNLLGQAIELLNKEALFAVMV